MPHFHRVAGHVVHAWLGDTLLDRFPTALSPLTAIGAVRIADIGFTIYHLCDIATLRPVEAVRRVAYLPLSALSPSHPGKPFDPCQEHWNAFVIQRVSWRVMDYKPIDNFISHQNSSEKPLPSGGGGKERGNAAGAVHTYSLMA